MPLRKGKDPEAIRFNIRELMGVGYPHPQALAIALSTARKRKRKS